MTYPPPTQPVRGQQPQDGAPPPFGAPQFGGGFPPPAPKKKSKVLVIVLVAVLAVVLLCVGGVVAFVAANKDEIDQAVDAARATAPAVTPATASPDPSAPPAVPAELVEPTKLGGRPRVTKKTVTRNVDPIEDLLASRHDAATATVSGAWGTSGRSDLVIASAVAAPIEYPQTALDYVLADFTDGFLLKNITEIDPGPLGGEARCGSSGTGSSRLVACAWADHGSVGLIIFWFKTLSQVKGEFVKLRGQIEKVD
jgi:hypothetical protein